jgi:hypothetical protein
MSEVLRHFATRASGVFAQAAARRIEAGACIPEAFRPCACVDYYPDGPYGVLWYYDCNGNCNLYHCSNCC